MSKNKNDEKVEETEWHNLAIWKRGLVDVAEKYLKKGSLVYIEGRLSTRSWDDQQGVKKYTTEIIVESFQMLGGKNDNAAPSAAHSAGTSEMPQQSSMPDSTDDADDLPF